MKRLLPALLLTAVVASGADAQQNSDYALHCNGTSDYVATGTLIATTNDFTIDMWINPTQPHEVDVQAASGISGIEGQHYALYPSHGTHCWGGGHVGVGISAGTNGVAVYEHGRDHMPAVLVHEGALSGWTHVAVVYRARRPQLFINGVLVGEGTVSSQPFVHPSTGETVHPRRNLGGIGGGYYGYFEGSIDEFRIWSNPLPATVVAEIAGGTQPSESGMIVHMDMNRDGAGAGLAVANVSDVRLPGRTFGTEATPSFQPCARMQQTVTGDRKLR